MNRGKCYRLAGLTKPNLPDVDNRWLSVFYLELGLLLQALSVLTFSQNDPYERPLLQSVSADDDKMVI